LTDAIPIAASVPVLQTFANRIGGEFIGAQALVPSGRSLARFTPGADPAALTQSRLFIHGGSPTEVSWLPRLKVGRPNLRVVDLGAGLAAPGQTVTEAPDPYPWTSPPLAKRMAWGIRDALIALDPPHAGAYRGRAAALARDLDDLDAALRETLSPVATRRFLALDPVWGQFARTYGLTQVSLAASGAESGGQAPAAPGSLSGLIDLALREGVRAVFVPPGADARLAAELAQAIGGRSARLDPLAADYFETLRRAAAPVADAELR
jgi:zinc transport system substrate-binding protein